MAFWGWVIVLFALGAALATDVVVSITYAALANKSGNEFARTSPLTPLMACAFGVLFNLQALLYLLQPLRLRFRGNFFTGLYGMIVGACSMVALVCYSLLRQAAPAILVITWWPAAAVLFIEGFDRSRRQPSKIEEDERKAAFHTKRKGFSRFAHCLWVTMGVLGWLLALLGIAVGIGFAVHAAKAAAEQARFPPAGALYAVAASDGSGKHQMHLSCSGPVVPGAPTFVFEPAWGMPGASYLAAQAGLEATYHRRSCIYDRAGYGWSELPEVPHVDPWRELKDLLAAAGEAPPYVLVGHGVGGEYAQLYAYHYPADVAGLALVDAYPNELLLRGQALGWGASELDSQRSRVNTGLQLARAFEPVGFLRPAAPSAKNFLPEDKRELWTALHNGRAWQARWIDWGKTGDSNTALLSDLAGPAVQPPDPANGLKWPPLPPSAKVLLLPADQSINGGAPEAPIYRAQVTAYNTTLSPSGNSAVAVCPNCDSSYPWLQPDWLATQLALYFI